MRAIVVLTLLLASCGEASPAQGSSPFVPEAIESRDAELYAAFGAMRDARACASSDPRTDIGDFDLEVTRTEHRIFDAWNAGLGDRLAAVRQAWEEVNAQVDKVCPHQVEGGSTPPSIETYRDANIAFKAAIDAAETD